MLDNVKRRNEEYFVEEWRKMGTYFQVELASFGVSVKDELLRSS